MDGEAIVLKIDLYICVAKNNVVKYGKRVDCLVYSKEELPDMCYGWWHLWPHNLG